MAFTEALLDTDILLEALRQNPVVTPKARAYLLEYGHFKLSIITRYEILRGFKAKDAHKQALLFDDFCKRNVILPLDEAIVVEASDIYGRLSRRGKSIGDADILIGATALANGLSIVTNNEKHFRRIPGLQIENWLK